MGYLAWFFRFSKNLKSPNFRFFRFFYLLLLLLLLSGWARQVVPIWGGADGRCPKEMRNSIRLSLSWNSSVMSLASPKYRWRSAAHAGQKRSKCSAVSSPIPQWEQIRAVICPMKAWYKAVDVSLLSLSWWIVLCACRGTPGGILGWVDHCSISQPVGGVSRFALSSLLIVLVPWLHSELLQVLECWSHVNVCLWLALSTSLFHHLVCPLISLHSYMSWYPYQMNNIFRISLSDDYKFFPYFATNSFILKASCFDACLESECILTAIAESVNILDTAFRALSMAIISAWYDDP